MDIDDEIDIDIFIWWIGHHSGGGCRSLYVLCEEGTKTAIVREQVDGVSDAIREKGVVDSHEFEEKRQDNYDDSTLRNYIENLSFNIFNGPEHNGFSANIYGLKMVMGDRTVTFEWLGKEDSFDENIVKLFQHIREM